MTPEPNTYYDILGLPRDAGPAQVEAAYLRARAAAGPGSSTEYLTHAYEVLRDPQRRQTYDALLNQVESSLKVQVQLSAVELPLLDEPQLLYLLADVQPRKAVAHGRLRLNLCLVVDRSTSMRGERLARVQEALRLLLEHLGGSDRFALVSFSDRAEVILPAGPPPAGQVGQQAIDGLAASGGTEIYQGLLAGMAQLRQAAGPDVNSQLILLTDGRTYGDEQQCLDLAAAAAKEGITFHAFGLGADWDDRFLDALVAPSGGLSEYVETPQDIITALEQRLAGLGQLHARDVRLSTALPAGLVLQDAFRLTPFAQLLAIEGEGAEIAIGSLESGASLKFLMVLRVAPQPIPMRFTLHLALRASMPDGGEQAFGTDVEFVLRSAPAAAGVPPDVLQAARLMTLCKLNERAWQEAEEDQPASAAVRLQHLATCLLEIDEPALAQQAQAQARQLAQTGALSEEGRKRLKYGTRALTRKNLPLEWDEPL